MSVLVIIKYYLIVNIINDRLFVGFIIDD